MVKVLLSTTKLRKIWEQKNFVEKKFKKKKPNEKKIALDPLNYEAPTGL